MDESEDLKNESVIMIVIVFDDRNNRILLRRFSHSDGEKFASSHLGAVRKNYDDLKFSCRR